MRLPQLIYKKIALFFIFVVLEVVAIILIVNNGVVQRYKIMEGVRVFGSFFWDKSNSIKNYTHLKNANRDLIAENELLLKENQLLRSYITREKGEDKLDEITQIISKNAGDTSLINYDFILARVIKNTRNSLHNYLIIDKGYEDGITEDLGVITPSGVIGLTRGVGKKHSYVLSLLNEKQSISAKVAKSEVYGTLKWSGTDIKIGRLTEIPLNVDVKEGDIVYTSGNSSFFPPNIPIGKARDFNVKSGTHKDIAVEFFQDYRNLDYVIVVKNNSRKEIDSLSSIQPTYSNR